MSADLVTCQTKTHHIPNNQSVTDDNYSDSVDQVTVGRRKEVVRHDMTW